MNEIIQNLAKLVLMQLFVMMIGSIVMMQMKFRLTRLESSDAIFRKIILLKILASMKPTTGLLEEKRIKFLHRKEAFLEELAKNRFLIEKLWSLIDFAKEDVFM